MFILWNVFAEYSLIGIVKPKFMRKKLKYDVLIYKLSICPKMCAKCRMERPYGVYFNWDNPLNLIFRRTFESNSLQRCWLYLIKKRSFKSL